MSSYNIRLGATLTFDTEQEADIIEVIEQLNSCHKTGKFLSNLIRIAFDNPDILDKSSGKYRKGEIIRQMEKLGVSYDRYKFMRDVSNRISDMKLTIDDIYYKTNQMYMLALMGKHIGLENKSDNIMSANFILEKQLKELKDTLGVDIRDSVYASNKLDKEHKKAEDDLEYILSAYEGVISELKSSLILKTDGNVRYIDQKVVEQTKDEGNNVSNSTASGSANEDSLIDFGDADIAALDNFFGDL